MIYTLMSEDYAGLVPVSEIRASIDEAFKPEPPREAETWGTHPDQIAGLKAMENLFGDR